MSAPAQPGPPRDESNQGRGCSVVLLVIVGLASASVGCGALCGGLFYMAARKGNEMGVVQTPPTIQLSSPAPAPFAGPANDWFSDRLLAPVYTTALDVVVADAAVTERLGSPVFPVNSDIEATALFRRQATGPLNDGADQTIEFDVKGEKEAAKVRVLAARPDGGAGSPPGRYGEYRVVKITVTFSDGTETEVPVPTDQPAVRPIR